LVSRIISSSTSANPAKQERTHAALIGADDPLMRMPLPAFVKELTERH
jgi:hypothetical protein